MEGGYGGRACKGGRFLGAGRVDRPIVRRRSGGLGLRATGGSPCQRPGYGQLRNAKATGSSIAVVGPSPRPIPRGQPTPSPARSNVWFGDLMPSPGSWYGQRHQAAELRDVVCRDSSHVRVLGAVAAG